MRRWAVVLIGSALWLTLDAAPSAGAPAGAPIAPLRMGPVSYQLPLPGAAVIVHPYDAPASPYAAGERGVDLAATAGEPVLAAGGGSVSFAGLVAGRGVVVITHSDGISTEYEPLAPTVTRGEQVNAGAVIGTISGVHAGCPPDACLHWGARRGDVYLNPMTLLERLGVVRLLPWPKVSPVALLCPRMSPAEGVAQSFDRDVGVDLGRGQAGVSKQLLHRA